MSGFTGVLMRRMRIAKEISLSTMGYLPAEGHLEDQPHGFPRMKGGEKRLSPAIIFQISPF